MVKDCKDEIVQSIFSLGGFNSNIDNPLKNLGFYEFSLSELGLPSHESLLNSVLAIKDLVGLQGWKNNNIESDRYTGFSLSYNPDFHEKNVSVYHQTWGSHSLPQSYGRKNGSFENKKNTYYDSFSFRQTPPIVTENLNYLFQKFNLSLLRSRVAWFYGQNLGNQKADNWHIDEPPNSILRINIPLQTSEEHVIDIVGNDECGNSLNIVNKHLEVGKAYIWNTRIPHRVTLKQFCDNPNPRIHMVLGFCTWFDYLTDRDSFVPNSVWGMNVDEIVNKKLFLKK